MKRFLLLLGGLAAGFTAFQCSEHTMQPNRQPARELTQVEKRLVQADNTFGLNLFREINSEDSDENLFISPLSVSMALGMTLNGADGETRAAMENALHLAGLSSDDINQSYRSLIDLLRNLDPSVKFQIANSIWFRDDFPFNPSFMDANRTYFDAVVRGLDFGDTEHVASSINTWVANNTNDKITKMIDASDIDANTVMYLINAIYFKGLWSQPFDRQKTRQEPFTRVDGSQITVDMMQHAGMFPYFATESFQAVELTYGDAGFAMVILLPRPGLSVKELIASFDQTAWASWQNNFAERNITLGLPRFTFEYEVSLKQALSALGMAVAFSEFEADFSRMLSPSETITGRLYLSEVKHKSFVEVNEEGTEAAAATSVEVGVTSLPPDVRCSRPFVFLIHDKHSNAILFAGKMLDPSQS